MIGPTSFVLNMFGQREKKMWCDKEAYSTSKPIRRYAVITHFSQFTAVAMGVVSSPAAEMTCVS